ncbi:hypothetical protein SAMN03159332_2116 [Paenibacillus sp. 276b]|nr:hypothetical protein SAMN03159332_2116 [Paenibacillus sp. 276b]
MRMSRWNVAFYSVVFVFVLVMLWNEQSVFLIVGTVLVATVIAFTIYVIYPMAWETRMDRVEAFLRKNHHTPYIYIFYVTANRLDDEVEFTMEKLRKQTTKKSRQAIYQAAYGAYRKDMTAVRQAVLQMRRSDYRTYYETFLLLEEEKSEQAREHLKSIRRQWMRSALLAEIERKLGRRELAIQHTKEAMNACKGVQRYTLTKEYERYYADEQQAQ